MCRLTHTPTHKKKGGKGMYLHGTSAQTYELSSRHNLKKISDQAKTEEKRKKNKSTCLIKKKTEAGVKKNNQNQ